MELHEVRTPAGNVARFWCRDDTTDRMTVDVDVEQDRYGIAEYPKNGGVLVDVGAHIGTWMVAALIDDPQATGVVVEPLTENVGLTIRNLTENGLQDRVRVERAAFAKRTLAVKWNYSSAEDPEKAMMHRYIGNFSLDLMPSDVEYEIERVKAITPKALLDERIAVLKVAGETSERALIGADLSNVDYLLGKYHAELPELVPWLLESGFSVNTQGEPGFGWYHARQTRMVAHEHDPTPIAG